MKKDLRATWRQAILGLILPIALIFAFRWLVLEPFVIPSGSMLPNLQIHDHILVNKLAYGIQWPFLKRPLVRWSKPKRGDIIVFHYPENPSVFYVKRVVAVPGDNVSMQSGQLYINDAPVALEEYDAVGDEDRENFYYYKEGDEQKYTVRYLDPDSAQFGNQGIPAGYYYALGDNRDQSADSRVWGGVPEELIVGRASLIWLSCESMLEATPNLCDPSTLRWSRIFSWINNESR